MFMVYHDRWVGAPSSNAVDMEQEEGLLRWLYDTKP